MILLAKAFSYFIIFINILYLLRLKKNYLLIAIGILSSMLFIVIEAPFTIYIFISLFIVFSFFTKNKQAILSALLFSYFNIIYLEIVVALFIHIFNMEINESIDSLIIYGLSYIIIRTKLSNKIYNDINSKFNLIFMVFLIASIFIIHSFNILSIKTILTIFIFFSLFYTIIIYTIRNYRNLENKQKNIQEHLELYEEMIEQYRITNHENKNLLLCIRSMSKEKNIKKFIDEIIKGNINENEKLFALIYKIPFTSLRGLFYCKLLNCQEKNININCNISDIKEVRVNSKTEIDICQIIGVLLDNAIEATLLTNNKNISIYLYQENNKIIIQISNTFCGTIYPSKLGFGFTTKGMGRGYGLKLVKSIINKHKHLKLNTCIENDIFIQKLEITLN